jgi:hypothetical protein
MVVLVVARALFTYEQTIVCLVCLVPESAPADLDAAAETQDAESDQQCVDLSGVLAACLGEANCIITQLRAGRPHPKSWVEVNIPAENLGTSHPGGTTA